MDMQRVLDALATYRQLLSETFGTPVNLVHVSKFAQMEHEILEGIGDNDPPFPIWPPEPTEEDGK